MAGRRRLLPVLFAALVMAGACGADDTAADGTSAQDTVPDATAPDGAPVDGLGLRGRTFLSESVLRDAEPWPLVEGTRIRLVFHADGRLGAQAGCNMLGGAAQVQDDRIVVGELATTEMGCDEARHEQDAWLAGFLDADPAYTLEGDTLRLFSGDSIVELIDRRIADPDRPLEATLWRLDGIVDGDAVSSVPGDGVATVRVVGESVLVQIAAAGTGECSRGQAEVEVRPAQLRVGPLAMAGPGCEGGAATVEDAVTGVLRGTVGYEIEAASLRITHPGGSGLVLRADG